MNAAERHTLVTPSAVRAAPDMLSAFMASLNPLAPVLAILYLSFGRTVSRVQMSLSRVEGRSRLQLEKIEGEPVARATRRPPTTNQRPQFP